MRSQPLSSEEIYDALADDDCFHALPSRLAAVFGARSTLIHWIYNDGSADIMAHSGYFSDEQLTEYAENFAAIDPWVEASTRNQPPNIAMDMEELVSVPAFTRSVFYNEYVRPLGDDTCRCMGIRVANEWGSGFIAFQRGRGQHGFEPSAVTALDQAAPHLRRMLSLRGRMSRSNRHGNNLASILDALGQAVFLLSATGRLLHANAAAEDMLSRSGALIVSRGMLLASSPSSDRTFEDALAKAVAPSAPKAGAVAIPCPQGSHVNLSLIALPLPNGRRHVLVTAHGIGPDETLASRLRALHKLSPAEARLAIMLADGAAPAQIAEQRGVALGTVRFQIKIIAAKLGCHRQADIVRVVKSLPQLRNGASPV